MIIREYIKCETCDHNHTLRIGMGQEQHQEHSFPCNNCGENITIALGVDFEDANAGLVLIDNAIKVKPNDTGSIKSLDASALIDPDSDKDHLEQRLTQARQMFIKQKELIEEKFGPDGFEKTLNQMNSQHLMLSAYDEWKHLKKSWSLSLRGKEKLSNKKINTINEHHYKYDPVTDINDWLWRFCYTIGGINYDSHFEEAIKSIHLISKDNNQSKELEKFILYFKTSLFEDHKTIFFNIFKEFFMNYDLFTQVHSYCRNGIKPEDNLRALSQNFDKIKMFYGNAFEAFTTLVEILACINNITHGREYNEFEKMDLDQYKKIDKANRCNPFSSNSAFFKLCDSIDNQIRNASHHNNFNFNPEMSLISYRSGKGGLGDLKEISYTDYLLLCTNIFLSISVLMRIEIILATGKH